MRQPTAEYNRRYREKHLEKLRAYDRERHRKNPERRRAQQAKMQALVVSMLGAACRVCGWSEFPEGMHAHHVDPSTKHPRLRGRQRIALTSLPISELEAECRKCIPLCALCHAGVEHGRIQLTTEQARTLGD